MSDRRQDSSNNGRAVLENGSEPLSYEARSSDEGHGSSKSNASASCSTFSDSDEDATATSFTAGEGRFISEKYRWVLHFATSCSNCEEFPICGIRHQAVDDMDINLCDDCFGSALWAGNSGLFKSYESFWDAYGEEGRLVPQAPLSLSDRGCGVYFLQKVMTDLGFMKIEHTNKQVGVFCAHTESAVAAFSAMYMQRCVTRGHIGVYDDMVENYLILHVVREWK